MSDQLEVVLRLFAVVGALTMVGVATWLNVLAVRRNRAMLRDHPERVPYGRRLLLRTSPFIVSMLGCAVVGLLVDDPLLVGLGVLGVVAFACDIWRRWQPPPGAHSRAE